MVIKALVEIFFHGKETEDCFQKNWKRGRKWVNTMYVKFPSGKSRAFLYHHHRFFPPPRPHENRYQDHVLVVIGRMRVGRKVRSLSRRE